MQNVDSCSDDNEENTLKEADNGDAVPGLDPARGACCSHRWHVAYLGVAMKVLVYVFTVNMAVALPYMNSRHEPRGAGANLSKLQNGSTLEQNIQVPQFPWDRFEQCFVLSAFFYGYLGSQIPAGWVISRFGWKHVVTCAVGASTLLTLLVPVSARGSVFAVIALRVMIGFCAGTTVPATFDLVRCWALPQERGRFTLLLWLGQCLGVVIGYATAGILCAHGFDDGWGSVFYIHGALGVVFLVPWVLLVSDRPEAHPRAKGAERRALSANKPSLHVCVEASNVPLRRILTSSSVWALFATHMFDSFAFCLLLLYMPLFMAEVLGFDVMTNGLLSALPFILSGVGFSLSAPLAEMLIAKGVSSKTNVRKLFGIIGLCVGGVFVMVPGYLPCDKRPLVVFCLCCCTLFLAVSQGGGYTNNAREMAPRFAEIILAISHCLAAIPGIITPFIVAELTPKGDIHEWRVVLDTAAVCALFGGVAYGVFSDCEPAYWAQSRPGEPHHKEDDRYTLVNGMFHPDELWP